MAACLMPAKAQQPGPFGFGGQQLQNNRADSLCSKIYRDINYVGDGEEYHNLDIYIPKKEGVDKFPVVVHIYGSAWSAIALRAWLISTLSVLLFLRQAMLW